MPFDRAGISTRVLRSDPVGVVLRADDPLARRGSLQVRDLEERPWFQFPEGTDPLWRAYWNGAAPGGRFATDLWCARSANACRLFSGTARSDWRR